MGPPKGLVHGHPCARAHLGCPCPVWRPKPTGAHGTAPLPPRPRSNPRPRGKFRRRCAAAAPRRASAGAACPAGRRLALTGRRLAASRACQCCARQPAADGSWRRRLTCEAPLHTTDPVGVAWPAFRAHHSGPGPVRHLYALVRECPMRWGAKLPIRYCSAIVTSLYYGDRAGDCSLCSFCYRADRRASPFA